MGRKLAALVGIVAAALVFGLGTAVESGHANGRQGTSSTQHFVADGQNPPGVAPVGATAPAPHA